ncbi:MAG: glycosyltransferase family 4 protein [Planctomycetaceae bacterium]|nr:glycosyltransferase family 4 protein [Planctomycetaceae bacterium]
MRIAIVRRVCSLKKAGAERYCVNLFRQLQRLGHDVTIAGEAVDDELRGEVPFLPVPVLRLTSWTRNRSFYENAARVTQAGRFDIVHGLSRVGGLDTYRLTDPLQTHWLRVYYRGGWQRSLQQWNPRHRTLLDIERRLFGPQGPRRIIVQSHLDARLLKEYFGVSEHRLRRVPNGVDLTVFSPDDGHDRDAIRTELGLSADQPLLVFASMDFRRKGLDSLLRALAKIERSETQLIVLGDGDIAGYHRRAEQLGVGERVQFLGRQSQMRRYYRAGDLFVLPTIYEPFPNVNLEAMACGLPVITTATAGGADIVQEGVNGALIPDAWAVDELTDRINRLLSQSATECERMAAACVATARQFPVERNAREVAAVLEEAYRDKLSA